MSRTDDRSPLCRQRAFSLLESVVSIVILGLAVAGFSSAYSTVMRHGSDAELLGQASTIAAAYLDEIVSRSFRDPDSGLVCAAPEPTRPEFDNVCDYDRMPQNGCTQVSAECQPLGTCVCDVGGSPVDGLRSFSVAVEVGAASIDGASGLLVDVRVTHEGLGGDAVGYRAFRTED